MSARVWKVRVSKGLERARIRALSINAHPFASHSPIVLCNDFIQGPLKATANEGNAQTMMTVLQTLCASRSLLRLESVDTSR